MKNRLWRGIIGLVFLVGSLMVAAYLSRQLFTFAWIGVVGGVALAPLIRLVQHLPSLVEDVSSRRNSSSVSSGRFAAAAATGGILILALAGAAMWWIAADGPDMAMQAEPPVLVEVGYRGLAEYPSENGSWSVKHTLGVDSAQMELASISRNASLRDSLSLPDILRLEGWSEAARTRDSVVYSIRRGAHRDDSSWPSASYTLTIPLPTVGRAVAPNLLILPREGSSLTVRAPQRAVIESNPKVSSREKIFDAKTEILRIDLPAGHAELREVRLKIARSPLRTSFGEWIFGLTGSKVAGAIALFLLYLVANRWGNAVLDRVDFLGLRENQPDGEKEDDSPPDGSDG